MECFCPILGRNTQVKPVGYSSGEWELVQCAETGFVFLPHPPTYEAVATDFAWEKTFAEQKRNRKQGEPLVSYFSNQFKEWRANTFRKRDMMFSLALRDLGEKQTLVVLDVGSGLGHRMQSFCRSFEQQGVRVIPSGIEISPELAKASDSVFRRFGGQVRRAPAYDGLTEFSNQEFDVVVMSCYLEHESKPLEVLRRARAVIKSDGVLIIKVPNYDSLNRHWRRGRWCGFRFPDHVNYFTPTTLGILAEQASYVMQPQRLSDRLPTSDNMYAVFKMEHAQRQDVERAA